MIDKYNTLDLVQRARKFIFLVLFSNDFHVPLSQLEIKLLNI